MKRLFLLLFVLLSSLAFGQGACRGDKVMATVGSLRQEAPVTGALVTIYAYTDAGNTTPLSLFSDPALSVPKDNPLTTDSYGQYFYCVASGTTVKEVVGSTLTTTGGNYQPVTVGGGLSAAFLDANYFRLDTANIGSFSWTVFDARYDARYAPTANPTFTGHVTVPTPTSSTDAVTKAYADTKAPIANPTFTGTVTVPSPANGTDAVTKTYADTKAPIASPIFTGTVATPSLQVTTGVTGGAGFQHRRQASCTTAAIADAVCDTSVTWNVSFADSSYTAVCVMGTPAAAFITFLTGRTTTTVSVRIQNIPGSSASAAGALDCIAVHD